MKITSTFPNKKRLYIGKSSSIKKVNHNANTTKSWFPCLLPTIARRVPISIFLNVMLLSLQLVRPTHADWLLDCGDCHCKWNSGKKTADCKNLSLSAVPENLSSEIQVLDLSINRIPFLEQNAFFTAQLHNLHKLYIRNSSLQQIDPRSFTQLEILIELDLSNNLLQVLLPNQFDRLVKVRAIVLNGNLLESLGDGIFQNLKYLHKIELKDNRLSRIGLRVFENVPLLSQIYLNGNRLSFLRKESFENLKRLTSLSLDQNPWNCTCELQIFRNFVLKRNLYTPPTACYYPVHLRGMLWVEEQPEAFACKPKIIYPSRGASINTSKENVTLVCRVHASPDTLIAWDYNKQVYKANAATSGSSSSQQQQQQQHVQIQLLRDEQSKEKEFGRDIFISRLTILGADKSDEGIYTCFAENAGGKDVVQMSLLLQKPGPRDLLLQGNLLLMVCLMALGLFTVSVFFAMVTCCIYKRFKNVNPTHHRHLLHHLTTGDQMSMAANYPAATIAGETDVSLGMGMDTSSVSDIKQHLQKSNFNSVDKYSFTDFSKQQHQQQQQQQCNASSVTDYAYAKGVDCGIPSNVNHHQVTENNKQVNYADRTCLELSNEDKLFKHNAAEYEDKFIMTNNCGSSRKNRDNDDSIQLVKSNENGELLKYPSEYKPDLLPAYNHKVNSYQHGQLYSQGESTKTINFEKVQRQQQLQKQHQQEQQQQMQQQTQQFVSATPVTKSKFNISAQEYLQSKYTSAVQSTTSKMIKSAKKEAPRISLTTSASLSTSAITNALAPHENGSSTLHRQSKSLAFSHRTSSTSTSNPTESSYEHRQPPPPPYNSAHRTASGVVSYGQNSAKGNILVQHNETKDSKYRNVKSNESEITDAGNTTPIPNATAIRQTVVTASSSLNFLTTTGCSPQHQLL